MRDKHGKEIRIRQKIIRELTFVDQQPGPFCQQQV